MHDRLRPADADRVLLDAGFLPVGAAADVPLLEGRRATVDGHRIAVFRLPAGFAAIDAACPHRGGPLHDGLVADGCVTCPLHGWRIDLASGAIAGQPREAVAVHEVTERDGLLYVRLAAAPERSCGADCDHEPALDGTAVARA
ncbi:Rieske (2Fe-2S) protein [Patulibacter defluvii]|uniref:Rieske (2Fe-2S) protein n=1 Tax=Patulibacter defluvii TaxID=3095358 RepID=UPI002A765523|nr:Rieske 2Fe-2S domain-containing protein [Patulibacter sp. DM4]